MNIFCTVLGTVICSLGILFALGKVHKHLSSFRKMTDEEKAGIRIKRVCINLGLMIILNGAIFITAGVWHSFKEHAFVWAFIVWMAMCVADAVFISKSKRYIR